MNSEHIIPLIIMIVIYLIYIHFMKKEGKK